MKKATKSAKTVKVLADGSNKLTLVFPKGTALKVKKTASFRDLAKVLGNEDDVEGQCRFEVRTPSAIGGVRG